MTRGFLALFALALTLGIGALACGTEGFRVVTSEGARRLAVIRDRQPVPEVALLDQTGRRFSLADYRGEPVLVEFIYTSCPTWCGVLGDDFHRIATTARGPRLLSISFDLDHDDRQALAFYGERYGAIAPRWRVAAPADQPSLERLLRRFGVVAVPDGNGGFVHNGALYLVDRNGKIARILDPGAAPEAIAAALGAS